MKRRLSPIFSTIFLLLIQLTAFTQQEDGRNKQILRESAVKQKIRDQEEYTKTLKLAEKKKWPLSIRGKEGRTAILVGVDPVGNPMYAESESLLRAAATIGTDKLWQGGSSGLNLSGNISFLKDKVALWDGGGVLGTHVELAGRITAKDVQNSTDGHATHVAGIMVSKGINPLAKGMAFGLPGLLSYNFTNHLSEMAAEAPNLLVSNHSYGSISGWRYNDGQSRWEWWGSFGESEDFKFGYYNPEAQYWDSLSYYAPNYLIVKSAGNNRNPGGPKAGDTYFRYDAQNNMTSAGAYVDGSISKQDGYDLLATYSNAKNILCVGNVLGIANGYQKPADVVLASSSSVGPTDDGRIKPDVVANGTSVISTYNGSNTDYASLSGTSMSSPTVSGSSVLLQELYLRRSENTIPAWSSTIKGVIIHTADEATGIPGPDYRNGWGLANFAKAAQVIHNNTDNLLQQEVLNNGEKKTYTVVASGKEKLKVSICWNDPPASVSQTNLLNDRTKKLVHDLDIRVKQGNRTFLPWKLDVAFPMNAATRGDNELDNVEMIEIDSAIIGETYTIEVTHKGGLTRSGKQNFTLIATGVGGKAYLASAPTSDQGSRIDSLSFAGIRNQNTAGCKTYSDFRNLIGYAEVGQTLPMFIRVNSCNADDAIRYLRVYLDLNNDGDFLDNGELMATSSQLKNGNSFTGNLSIPNTLNVGTTVLMRIVMSETADANSINSIGAYAKGETQDYLITITSPSNDLAAGSIVYPQNGECASPVKYITLKVRNLGTVPKSNIPVEVEIRKGNTLVTTIKDTCRFTLNGQSEIDFTLQRPFVLENDTYTFTARTLLDGDQLPANNGAASVLVTSAPSATPTDLNALICNGTEVKLRANTTNNTSRLAWFATATSTIPIATSSTNQITSSTSLTLDKKYFVATDDIRGSVGPVNKLAYTSGGYNEFAGNFVRFSNQVPMLIESVRLYTANPGKITIILADLANEPNAQGQYSYYTRDTRVLNALNSRPQPPPNKADLPLVENSASDTGFIYNLNLVVSEPGNHILITICEGATIFRNNNIALPGPYPLKLNEASDLFSITGNGVVAPSNPNNFYYFFYDMKVSTLTGCPSPRVSVTANNNVLPVISQNGNTLTSSATSGSHQWRLNGQDIFAANSKQFVATESGTYRVALTDSLSCVGLSNELNVIVTSVNNVDPSRIGLILAPNPNHGLFNVQFSVTGRDDLNISVISAGGQEVYRKNYPRFSGTFNEQVNLQGLKPGIYMMRINHGMDQYVRRILID